MSIQRSPTCLLIVVALGLLGGVALAAGERNPFDFSVATYVWVMLLSALGGAVHFHRKLREGKARAINFTEFIGELVTSAFAGLLTFWLCKAAGIDDLYAAVLIGISGHMGSRAIFGLERWAERRIPGAMPPDQAEKE